MPSFLLDNYVYTWDSACQAAQIFREHCQVEVTSLGGTTEVNICVLPGAQECIADEFLNYVLGLSVEQLLR